MKARGRLARGLALALFVLPVATAGIASAQYREFTGKINKVDKSALIVDNRMGDKLQFERIAETRISDERDAKKKKTAWKDLRELARESHQSIGGLLTDAIREYVRRRRVRPIVLEHLDHSIAENEELGRLLAE